VKRFLGSITVIILISLLFVIGTTSTTAETEIESLNTGDLVITEIMQDPTAVTDANGEWFEIFNNSGVDIDLEGLMVVDKGTNDFIVIGTLVVNSGDYLVFGINGDINTNGGVMVDYEYSGFTLANGDDEIILELGHVEETTVIIDKVIDKVEYDGSPNFPDPTGASMSLDPRRLSATDNDFGCNWCEASSQYNDVDYGTPGATNDLCSAICEPVAPIPEWSTILLMSLGLLGLGTYIVLRKKRAGISI